MSMHLKHGLTRFDCTKQLNLLVVLGWVGLGQKFSTCNELGLVGSVSWWTGLDRVTQNGPMDNSEVCKMCRRHAAPTQAQVRLHWTAWRSDLSLVNYRRSCLSCCWSKSVEWPAKRCYVGLVAVAVKNSLKTYLFRRCYETVWLSITFPFPSHYLPPKNSNPCNSFYCLGHFKNVHDDDDDDKSECVW